MSDAGHLGSQSPPRDIVLVAGMHRSGTSALTRVCNLLGAALPEPLVPPSVGNEHGHWEPAEVVALNDRALLAAGSDVNSVFPVSESWQRSAAGRAVKAEITAYSEGLNPAAGPWFIKDPRISLLSGLWCAGVEAAGSKPRIVIAFREPWEVANSLAVRQIHYFPDEVWPVERALAIWLNYVLSVERKTRGLPRTFVSYDAFLKSWSAEVDRLYGQLGLAAPEQNAERKQAIQQFLRPDARHFRTEAAFTRDGLASDVYQLLLERENDPHGQAKAFDQARRSYVRSLDLLGGYLGALERKASELTPLKQKVSETEKAAAETQKRVNAAELRILHLTRTATADSPRIESERSSAQNARALALQDKYDALHSAHRDNVRAFQAAQKLWQEEHDRLTERVAEQLEDAKAQCSLRERAMAAEDIERLRSEFAAERMRLSAASDEAKLSSERFASLEHAHARTLEQRDAVIALIQAELATVRSESDRLQQALQYTVASGFPDAFRPSPLKDAVNDLIVGLKAHLQASSAAAQALRTSNSALGAELSESKAAYEDIRRDFAALRQQLERVEIDRAEMKLELEEAAAKNFERQLSMGEMAERLSRLSAELDATRAELSVIHQSRSWKITAPLRSATSLLGSH